MQFLDLADDDLLYICDYLSGQYALDLSLTCKRLYSLAINRTAVTFTASTLDGLRAFHRSVLQGSPSRVQHVRSLYTPLTAETAEALVDLLQHTHNLARLSLQCGDLRQSYYHILFPTLYTLRHLTHLEMDSVSDNDVKVIGESEGWDLRALYLDHAYHLPVDIGEMITYSVLIDTIAKYPHLYLLRIRVFEPRGFTIPLPGDGHTPIIGTFPSIRRLFVSESWTIAGLDLISRCPNINMLDLSYMTGITQDISRKYRFPMWPPLRSLRFSFREMEELCVNDVVQVGSALHLRDDLALYVVDDDEDDSPVLLSMLQRVAPVWVQVRLYVGGTPMRFWKDVPSLPSRLRYLELKIFLKYVKEEYADWLENVPSAVSSLPLHYLKLYIQDLRTSQIWSLTTGEFARNSDGQYVHDTTKRGALAFAFNAACVATAETLPERCAREIPTLKFFVLSDEGQLKKFERARRAAGGEPQEGFILPIGQQEGAWHADEEIVDRGETCEADDYSHFLRAWGWPEGSETMRSWRIARDASGDGLRLQRLGINQGRRLERCLGVCFDNKDPLDDILTFYRDSDAEAS
ncbi:hypothetical protein C8Q80DRAFT_1160740 [Daedaleopsis nitida]|nr:hypothetical protein C8Q80DRAFT_1160740 [Daedaleopsis nitida]